MPTTSLESQQALATAIGRRLYGFAPTAAQRLPSASNHVFRVEFGGLPPKVIKLPGRSAALLREQRVIRTLRQGKWGLPVPAIEFTQDDLPPLWDQAGVSWPRPRALTVMPHCPGMTLVDAILRGEPWVGEAMRQAGSFAAALAEVPAAVLGRAQRAREAQLRRTLAWVQPVMERFNLNGLQKTLEEVVDAACRAPSSLAHGELFPENIICQVGAAGVRLIVLDWEKARPLSPLADLGGLLASLAQLALRDEGGRAYLRRRTIDGFTALRPFKQNEAQESRGWEILFLLSAARHAMDTAQSERATRLSAAAQTVMS